MACGKASVSCNAKSAQRAELKIGPEGPPTGRGVQPQAPAAALFYNSAMYSHLAAYIFTPIDAPQALADALRARAEALELLGTVLVAGEGVNLFLAGAEAAIDAFLQALHADPRFDGLSVKRSVCAQPPFARLKVKVKQEIISFRQDRASPLAGRAPAVSPQDLRRWLAQGRDDAGRPLALLDTRNREETAYGTFVGALTLPIDNFVDLPAALESKRAALDGATVVSFCTGGIRCEKAALWMREAGFGHEILQLDGGILGYFEAVGGDGWQGDCFVFDARIALDPSLSPLSERTPPDALPSGHAPSALENAA